MQSDVLDRCWHQIRGHARQWWGELTDDDLDEIQGRRAVLVGKLQARYGRTREEAEVDVNRFLVRARTLLKLQ
ncbi:MAG: CsbD family protein [Betaproteobacteria bacterium]|nr:CsbD family protein [Betaproteobacteria bacterium]